MKIQKYYTRKTLVKLPKTAKKLAKSFIHTQR